MEELLHNNTCSGCEFHDRDREIQYCLHPDSDVDEDEEYVVTCPLTRKSPYEDLAVDIAPVGQS